MQTLELLQRWRELNPRRIAFGGLLAAVCGITFSTSLGQALAGVALLAWGVALARREVRLTVPAAGGPALAFVALAAITSVAFAGVAGAWDRGGKLFWFLFLPLTASLVVTPRAAAAVLRAFALGCTALALHVGIQGPLRALDRLRAGKPPGWSFLDHLIAVGSMTDGQMLMLGIVVVLILLVAARRQHRRAWPWAVALALQAVALGVTFKRGSWVVAAVLVVALAAALRNWKVLLALILIAVVGVLLPPVRTRLRQAAGEFDVDGGGRLTMWFRAAPALVREHPLGIGYGAMTEELMQRVAPQVEKERNHLHSNVAEVLVETGWPGLWLYGLWMGTAVAAAAGALRRARAAGEEARLHALAALLMLAGLLLNGLVEYNFGDSELILILAVVMGLAAAWGNRPSGAAGRTPGAARGTPPPAVPAPRSAGG